MRDGLAMLRRVLEGPCAGSSLCHGVMTILVSVQIVSRYVFNFLWLDEEMARFAFVWVSFWASA